MWLTRHYACIIITYAIFLTVCAVIFSYIEDVSFVDSLYFTVVTQSTVGYGDITPKTNGGMVFNFFFIMISFGSIIILFNVMFHYWFNKRIITLVNEITEEMEQRSSFVAKFYKKQRQKRLNAVAYALVYLIWLIVWIIFFASDPKEDLTFFESFYFGLVTSTTIGYGRIHPISDGGKVFVIFWMGFGVISLGTLLGALSDDVVHFLKRFEPKSMKQNEDADDDEVREKLVNLLKSHEKMTKYQFILVQLQKQNKVKKEDIEKLEKAFNKLDVNRDGQLDEKDLRHLDSVGNKIEFDELDANHDGKLDAKDVVLQSES